VHIQISSGFDEAIYSIQRRNWTVIYIIHDIHLSLWKYKFKPTCCSEFV